MVIISEFAPNLPPKIPPNAQNGGRVQSITVNPTDSSHIIVANQFGGLWKTTNGGENWFHLDGLLTIFVRDVAYGPDGDTVIATVARDNWAENGGGIWLSHNGGQSWSKPSTGDPHNDPALPNRNRVPERITAYGISYSPDEPHKVYVGTDYGVALSRDNGNTWSHIMLYTNEPIWGVNGIAEPKMQNSVISLLTLPDKKVIALTGTGVYRTDDDELWRQIRQGNFAYIWNLSCKNIDVSSRDSDKVFILQDYSKLLFYEVADEKWTQIDLPGGSGRGPFVRVSNSSSSDTSIDIWVGTGVNLLKTTCSDAQFVTRLNASSWNTLDWANGIHPDTGYLALDNDKRPLLYGSDGGIFRYTHNATWTGINTGRTGTNSHLITDLAGTNVRLASGVGYNTTLYFATQDNDIWASSDGGTTWPNSDSTEGYCIQVRQDATSDREARVGYVKIRVPRFSDDVNLSRSRDVPNVDINNKPLSNMSQAFFVSPNKWIRYRALRNGETQVYISTNNGNNWRRRAIVKLEEMGFISASGDPSNPVIYMPLKAARRTTLGNREIIGLLKVNDLFNYENVGKRTFEQTTSSFIYLPNDGSLGRRATEFDWHTVYGVNPRDPEHIIAPDVYNQVVKVSRNGGGSWITDDNLTNELTRKGKLLYGGDEYRIQITQISFDPYNQNRILIGTRDAGIIISEDGGYNWSTIPHSAVIQYITNFFFKHNNIVVVSSYGRGLWKIDLNGYPESFPFEYYCLGDCIKRRPDIPEIYDDPIDWADKEVVIVLNGKINGLITSQGEIKTVTVTLGSLIKCYIGNSEDYVELNIIESDEGEGFNDLKGCMAALENQEIIKGIILKEKKLFGIISGKKEFKEVKEEKNKKNEGEKKEKQTSVKKSEADFKQPYLFVTTSIPLAGEPILGDDRIINLFGTGFSLDAADKDVTIILDGQKMEKGTKVSDKGNIRFELVVPEEISEGKHIVEVKQKTSKEEIVVTHSFLIAAIDDFD